EPGERARRRDQGGRSVRNHGVAGSMTGQSLPGFTFSASPPFGTRPFSPAFSESPALVESYRIIARPVPTVSMNPAHPGAHRAAYVPGIISAPPADVLRTMRLSPALTLMAASPSRMAITP